MRSKVKLKESRPGTKDKSGKGAAGKKLGSKSPPRKDGKGGKGIESNDFEMDQSISDDLEVEVEPRAGKEFAEVAIQDEGGDPASALVEENKLKTPGTRQSRRSRSTLAPVEEFDGYEDSFDLDDEQSWSTVAKDQLQGRFSQYRRICRVKLQEAEEQRQLTVAKTQRKVQLLKAQFVEHKTKWETERRVLIDQVEQAQSLQGDAEKEADQAMTQLEDFITEQEKLEEEEEVRRSAILSGHSGSAPLTPGNLTPITKTPSPAAGASAQATPRESRTTQHSDELQKLMQQTDDAKAQELRERLVGTKSAPPGVDALTTTANKGQTTSVHEAQQTSDLESVDGVAEEATKQTVVIEELLDLPPIDGSAPDTSVSPSIQPPPTAATIGSMPAHDQLETPLAEIADLNASDYAKGDEEAGEGSGELKEEISNLEKGHTNVTEERQGITQVTDGTGKEATQVEDGSESQSTGDNTQASKSTQPPSKTPDAIFKMEGDTEEDLRDASARSRASLRSHYKNRLGESRQAAEDRRSNTPQISLPSKMSVDEELVLDDDDDFDEMALPNDLKDELDEEKRKDVSMYEMGTSPPPGSGREPSSHSVRFAARKASSLGKHPILKHYLKNYHGVTSFKDTLSKLFLDKDMMSASQILADLESLAFEPDKKVMPQVELLTANALYILEEIASVIQNAVMVDREPPVSSLLLFSRDEMRNRLLPTREASEDIYTHPKMVTPASGSVTEQVYVNSLQGSTSGSVGAVSGGVGADGTEPAVVVETTAAEMLGRASEFDAPPSHGGSRAGSLQGSNKSSMSGSTKHYLLEMQSQCTTLQTQLEQESKKHEDQLRHNTVVMMEMQDTINELQRELSAIGKSSGKPRSDASSAGHVKAPSPDQSLMFTRLDLERNAKIMKKAVLDQRLDADTYKDVVTTMDDYVSLPAERLGHLVKKYVHHSRMKEIEDNVKKSRSLDEGVFDTLDKMEALQNQRARHWAEKMDTMGVERLRLAAMLMDSLDNIENQSGLFLIKPMYSFRGRELKAPPTQKLARPVRTQPVPRYLSATHSATSFVPAPTPASNARRMDRHTPTQQYAVDLTALPPPSRPEDGVIGAGAIRNIVTPQAPQLTQSFQTWNMSVSHARSPLDSLQQHSLNTPRMLELDINRMLIGQNNVSTKLPQPPTDDRLQNATNNGLRSYVTVQRPTATLTADRATSVQGVRATGAPPSSPSPRPSPRPSAPVSPADRGLAHTLTSHDPLPPIGDRPPSAVFSDLEDPEPPRSPPGSSMYQSTTHDADDNTKTVNTRPSSQLSD
ncbi:hypothetical protein V1264_005690 [Littorina saxatilis]|uniref:Uncharacterized protein n=1 Tax=Littorina saxatilis TaxID=31220 RepID=A0AAN9AZR8_9CAEN